MARWSKLFYCQRCDGVFIPREAPLFPAAAIDEVLLL
jgi:hypothetical protein